MSELGSITLLKKFEGKKVEIIAYGICYMGNLDSVNYEAGTLVLSSGEDSATLELERVESFSLLEKN